MNAEQTLATQRLLLDRLLLAGMLPYWRYLHERQALADVPRVCCANHPDVGALVYAPDEHTPLCGLCGLVAYEQRERTPV